MFKYIMIGILPFLLSSCFNYYQNAEQMKVEGYIDGPEEQRYNWNLVYQFDDDTVYVSKNFLDSTLKITQNGYLKFYEMFFCNVLIGGGDVLGCMNRLRGKVDVKIYLKNIDEEKGILLAQKTIDMDAYYRSILLTQVFLEKIGMII